MRGKRNGRSALALILIVMAALALLAGLYSAGVFDSPADPPRDDQGEQGQDSGGGENEADETESTVTQATLNRAIEAVAAAEDAEFGRAMQLWSGLLEEHPEEVEFQLNQAVTVLKWIDETNNLISGGTVTDPDERKQLDQDLQEAYSQADSVIESLAGLQGQRSRSALLQAALIEAKSRQLSYPDDLALRRSAAELLAKVLADEPGQPILACKFDDLVQELADEDDPLLKANAEALFASWKAEPRNLYLLSRAADTLMRGQDRRVLELLDPLLELTKPMQSGVASQLRRLDPVQLMSDVRAAVAADDWRKARRLTFWLNVCKGMSGFQPDVRLVKPDIMALLDTTFLTRLAERVPSERNPTSVEWKPSFEVVEVPGSVQAFAWLDDDIDSRFDLAVVRDQKFSLIRSGDWSAAPEFELDLDMDATGMIAVDLFEVDNPGRPFAATSVAELMEESNNVESDKVISGNQHDTLQELLVWGEDGVCIITGQLDDETKQLSWSKLETPAGLEALDGITCVAPLDMESDGDLDLIIATSDGCRILQNNGNRTFKDVSEFSDLASFPTEVSSMVVCDFETDLDQDALFVSPTSRSIMLVENLLHGQFRLRALDTAPWPELESPLNLQIAELDGNSSWDWIVLGDESLTVVTTRTPAPGTVVPLQVTNYPATATLLTVEDFNSDGYQDALVAGSGDAQAFLGIEGGRFADPTLLASLEGEGNTAPSLQALDANADGLVDVAMRSGDSLRLLLSSGEDENQYLSVRLRGINDLNGGGRINHFSIGSTLEVWSDGRQMRKVVSDPVTLFGLGGNAAENLRVVFTNGLTQNLENPPPETIIHERQELKGSCPFLYGWDGEKFVLITDLLWNAPLGLQVAPGEVLKDRRWEYLAIDGQHVQMRDGAYELRITEELWEFAYFDHVALSVVDHPPETLMFTNEKVGPPTIAEPKVFVVRNQLVAERATSARGRDLRQALATNDGQYAQPFQHLHCQGLAEPHYVELDFGRLPENVDAPKLVLHGWLYPTDTSLNIGISQNTDRLLPEPPSLWIPEGDEWVCKSPFIGFPGGKPKSIVVDLDGVFNPQDPRMRIAGSQQIYWDSAFLTWGGSDETAKVEALEIESAELRYRGFSQLMDREPDEPHWYDYQMTSTQPKWPELDGPFTRFGDVLPQLVEDDDQLVVMTAGDEIVIRFEAPEQQLANGWRRDFVLHSVGWDKDADINTLAGQTSLPLPFKEQEAYPPPPEQQEQAQQALEKNEATLTRQRQWRPSGRIQ